MNRTPVSQELRPTSEECDFLKLKSFCLAESTVDWVRRKPTERERIFASYTPNRGLTSRI